MVDQPGFFDLSDRLQDLSAKGDDLERIAVCMAVTKQATGSSAFC